MEETPITKSQARSMGIMTALHLVVYYGIAFLIWGFVFQMSLIWFGVTGIIVGLLLSLVSAPVVSKQQSLEKSKDMMFAISSIWGNLAIIIGILGLISWGIKLVFFH